MQSGTDVPPEDLHARIENIDASAIELPRNLSKQAVRTTFRMSSAAYDDLAWLSRRYDATLKEVLDLVLEFLVVLLKKGAPDCTTAILGIAREDAGGREMKRTHTVSRSTLDHLKDCAEVHGVARDALLAVTVSVYRMAVEEGDRKRRDEQLPRVLSVLEGLCEQVDDAESRVAAILAGDEFDDPITRAMREAAGAVRDVRAAVCTELDETAPDTGGDVPPWG